MDLVAIDTADLAGFHLASTQKRGGGNRLSIPFGNLPELELSHMLLRAERGSVIFTPFP